jgi:hypothetical protein
MMNCHDGKAGYVRIFLVLRFRKQPVLIRMLSVRKEKELNTKHDEENHFSFYSPDAVGIYPS